MNKTEIMEILPHRDNMLLLDEVEEKDGIALGKFHVTGDEWFLKGHFPENPVVPGVILCEILAQSVCILMKDKMQEGKLPLYTGINNVRFRNQVKPGDTFITQCRIIKSKEPFYFAEGKGFVNNELSVKAEFSFTIAEIPIPDTENNTKSCTETLKSGDLVDENKGKSLDENKEKSLDENKEKSLKDTDAKNLGSNKSPQNSFNGYFDCNRRVK